MKPIDENVKVGDEVVTKDGREGRIICVDRIGDYPVIALIKRLGSENIICCTKEGFYYEDKTETHSDIFYKPKKVKLDIYKRKEGLSSSLRSYLGYEQNSGSPDFNYYDHHATIEIDE